MAREVAVLYVDPRGPYPKLGVDCWDEARDAARFAGRMPVVAHPPCGPWGRLHHMSRKPVKHLAQLAVWVVRANGGVLEHPVDSKLWVACGMPRPNELPDPWGGVTVRVDQCEWGHVARKATWLYLVRVPSSALEQAPFPGRAPTHWVSGGRGRDGMRRTGSPVPPGIKVCSAQQRRRTPPLFAEYLIRLARASRG